MGRPFASWLLKVLSPGLFCLVGGCAALTNPVAEGIPVHRLPPELLACGRQSDGVACGETCPVEVFYTGGLLPPGEHVLPCDRDLDVVEAVARCQGTLIQGGFGANNLSGALIAPGIGGPSPSLLVVIRRLPDGQQVPIRVDLNRALVDARERILVQPHDLLILQETPCEAVSRGLHTTNWLSTLKYAY